MLINADHNYHNQRHQEASRPVTPVTPVTPSAVAGAQLIVQRPAHPQTVMFPLLRLHLLLLASPAQVSGAHEDNRSASGPIADQPPPVTQYPGGSKQMEAGQMLGGWVSRRGRGR